MTSTAPSRRGPWAFVAVFAVCTVGLLGGYRYAIDTIANDYYLFTISRHTTWILDFVGQEATLEKHRAYGLSPWESWRDRALPRRDEGESGPRVSFVLNPGNAFTFIVVPSCGAIEVMAIFLAAVLAFPATWSHRAWGIALGLPLLYLVNIFRLACLACLGAIDQSGAWFNFVHEYVWQAGYVIFVVIVWMAWAEWDRERPAP
jgi:exosortase/archaeosortase family protein